jgi:hypothetical protein
MGGRVPTLTFFGDRRATSGANVEAKLPSGRYQARYKHAVATHIAPDTFTTKGPGVAICGRRTGGTWPARSYGAGSGPSQYPYRVFCSLAWRQSDRPRRLERLHFHVLNLLQSPTVVAHPPGAVVAISANPGARAGCGARICSGTWPAYPLDIDTVDDLALLTACPKRRSPFRTVVARVLTELGGSQALPAN